MTFQLISPLIRKSLCRIEHNIHNLHFRIGSLSLLNPPKFKRQRARRTVCEILISDLIKRVGLSQLEVGGRPGSAQRVRGSGQRDALRFNWNRLLQRYRAVLWSSGDVIYSWRHP